MKVFLYVDGACSGNPGPGGAAYKLVAVDDTSEPQKIVKELSGSQHLDETTNNRAEIMAAILGLREIKSKVHGLVVISDSNYLVNTMNRQWKRNMNLDLWEELDNLLLLKTDKVIFRWRKRNTAAHQKEVDALAKAATSIVGDVNQGNLG